MTGDVLHHAQQLEALRADFVSPLLENRSTRAAFATLEPLPARSGRA